MPKTQMVCGVPCEILENSIEQGIYWQNDVVWPVQSGLVVRPDTGDILMVHLAYGHLDAVPCMGDDVLDAKITRSLTKLAHWLANRGLTCTCVPD